MSSTERLERKLPTLLDELAAARTPDYFDDLLSQVARTRQRPGWSIPERWLPMSAVAQRLAIAPRLSWRAAVAAALLLVALVMGLALLAGSQRPTIPAPFGVAGNGLLAYVDDGGAIRTTNLAGDGSTVIVAGPDNERPVHSPDGTRLAYLHREASGGYLIMVVGADGQSPKAINVAPYESIGYLGWSPDGDSIVAAIPPNELVAFDIEKGGPAVALATAVYQAGSFGSLDAFNASLPSVFRPPAGNQFLYIGSGADGLGLYSQSTSGGEPVALLTQDTSPIPFAELASPQWSPDGSQIAVTLLARGTGNDWRVHVLNADGTGLHRLTRLDMPGILVSEAWPAWSPDGRLIALMRWFNGPDGSADTRPITVVDVATGAEQEVGTVNVNGYAGWGWSPDGASIIEVPQEPSPDAGTVLIVDVASGNVRRTGLASGFAPSWQRTLP